MKNLYTKAAIFIALCMVWLPQATAATSTYDIESNGLYYTITDTLEPGMKYAGIVKVVAPPTGKYDGEVTIPSSFSATIKNSRYSFLVSAIGANAFASSTVTKVTLPTTILTIGDNAFSNCQRLDSVKVAENAYDKFKLKEIGANAFRDCYNLSSFHFGKYLQSIGETAFCYCYELSDLTLQRSATIASKAFMGSGIKSLTLPDTARYEIKSQTFMNCKWLEKADLGGTVYLADMAFSICYSLTSVKATKVRYIGVNVFEWCKNLTTLDFGESTDGITVNDGAFINCPALTDFNALKRGMICFYGSPFGGTTKLQSASFSANSINKGVLSGNTSLRSVKFGEVYVISDSAFAGCTALSDIDLGNSHLKMTIYDNAFKNCTSLSKINTAEVFCTEIKAKAFDGCTGLQDITLGYSPSILKKTFANLPKLSKVTLTQTYIIGDSAFANCPSLTTFDFGADPKTALTVGEMAFAGCSSLSRINITGYSSANIASTSFTKCTGLQDITLGLSPSILKKTFANLPKLSKVTLTQTYIIGDSAFANCPSLTTFNFGEDKKTALTVGEMAFAGCSSLSRINITGYLSANIASTSFNGCTGLQDITLGYSPSILKKTFANLPKLSKVTLTQTYIIGDSAFANCPSLTTFDFGADPKTALTVGEMAFAGCSSLSRINITGYSSANIASTSFTKCTGLQDITLGLSPSILKKTFANLPKLSKVTLTKTYIIGDSAFANCPKLTTFSFGEDKNTSLQIGNMAFAGCSSLSSVNTLGYLYTVFAGTPFAGCSSLAQLYTKVTLLPKGTFAYLPNLRTVSFKSVYEIGASAFEGCTKLSSVDFGKQEDNGDHSVVINSMAFANTSISQLSNSDRTIVITSPTAFKGNKSLTLIDICTPGLPAHAFQGSPKLANVTLRNVIEIADEAFSGCESLNKVTLTAMNSTQGTTIGNYAFAGSSIASFSASYVKFAGKAIFNQCHSLTDVTITSTPIVTDSLFAGTALTNVTLNADTIGRYAFAGTPLNGNVNLGNVKRIQHGAFMNSSIVTMKLPSTVKLIPEKAFANCQYLRWVGFDAVTTIEAEAFRNCENLQKIVLPATVTYIGKYAFAGTRSMRSVYSLRLTPPSALLLAFGEEVRSKTLYVYPSAYLKYAAAYVWCDFGSYEKPDLSGVDNVEANSAVTIKAENGTIIVDGAASGERVDVYSVGGRLVYSGTASEPIDVPSGIYVVRTADTSVKVKI